jgi:uroporphyrinogen-III synthase
MCPANILSFFVEKVAGNRGAIVEYAECYQRSRPNGDVTNLLKQIHNDNITVITVTSNEALQNLFDMVEETHRQHLLNTPLIVVSDRGKQLALELGFNESVIVANKPSDEAILAAVLDWKLAG